MLRAVPKALPEQELVFLEIIKNTARPLIPESALEQEDIRMTPSLVEMMQQKVRDQTMERSTSKLWDISWCSDKGIVQLSVTWPSSNAQIKLKYVDVAQGAKSNKKVVQN